MALFPMFVDLKNKKCVIAGGGTVAYRKAKTMLEYEACVSVISPEIIPALEALAFSGRIYYQADAISVNDLTDADIVLCATDDEEVNRSIAAYCRTQKIPVNVADSLENCSFIFPALVKRDAVVAGITTSGAAPALSRYIREKLEEEIPEWYGPLAKQLSEKRKQLKGQPLTEEEKRIILYEMILEEENRHRAGGGKE